MTIAKMLSLLAARARERWRRAVYHPILLPLTIKHYYCFDQFTGDLKDGQLYSPELWDVLLRLYHPHFLVPTDRDAWLAGLKKHKDGQDPATRQRAAEIAQQLSMRGITDVHSVGVGCAPLEYHLKALAPSVHLTASDYSPGSIARLQKIPWNATRLFSLTSYMVIGEKFSRTLRPRWC